jgi:hypothetical protein
MEQFPPFPLDVIDTLLVLAGARSDVAGILFVLVNSSGLDSVPDMGEDEIYFKPDVDENDRDRVVAASSLVASAVPMIGSVVAEAIKHAIPNQRVDRMADMLKILDRLSQACRRTS